MAGFQENERATTSDGRRSLSLGRDRSRESWRAKAAVEGQPHHPTSGRRQKAKKKEAERTLSVMRYAMRTFNWGPEAKGQTWRHNLRQALAALGPSRESEGERVRKKKGKGNERPGLGPARGWCSWSGLEEMREGVVCVLRLVSRKAHRES